LRGNCSVGTPVRAAHPWLRDAEPARASERIEVELDERTWRALAATSERRRIDPERLARSPGVTSG